MARRAKSAHRDRMRLAILLAAIAACGGASNTMPPPVALPELPVSGAAPSAHGAVADLRCGAPPKLPRAGFRHHHDHLIAELGHPHHRAEDVIAMPDEDQHVAGKLAYGALSLDDEDVELYACTPAGWARVAQARSDGGGHFAIALAGAQRLGAGLRDLYARVPADDTGTLFTAFVAPRGTPIAVTDVDGTLTASENAFPESLVLPVSVAPQPDAAAALARSPVQVVYLTARGEHFTNATRRWLGEHGFPRGPVRFAPGWFARPGDDALAAKTHVLAELTARFAIAAGIGNRASDVAAYAGAGVPAEHIFVKLPEKERELEPLLAAHAAIGFASYAALDLSALGAPANALTDGSGAR